MGAQEQSIRWQTKSEVYGKLEGVRLQFVWKAPGEAREIIWSMKTDGSDMRPAVDPELLFSGEARDLKLTPVRSPDGRYIACVGRARDDDLWFLVDLKEKRLRTMRKGLGAIDDTNFAWTPDSKQVLFYADAHYHLYQYTVENGTLELHPMIHAKGFRIVDGGRGIVAVRDDAIEYLDRAGKMLKRVVLPKRLQANPEFAIPGPGTFISSDGRTFVLPLDKNSRRAVVSVDDIAKPMYEDDRWYLQSAFGPDGKALYFSERQSQEVMVLDLASGRITRIAELPGRGADGLTAFDSGKAR